MPKFPVKYKILGLQSLSLTLQLSVTIHLPNLHAIMGKQSKYDPEIFPAVRLLEYNPLCVNVFSSGKVVIFGLREDYQERAENIYHDLHLYTILSTLI